MFVVVVDEFVEDRFELAVNLASRPRTKNLVGRPRSARGEAQIESLRSDPLPHPAVRWSALPPDRARETLTWLLAVTVQGSKRYPMPGSVWKCLGREWSTSSFRRTRPTSTRRYSVSVSYSGPHTSWSSWRWETNRPGLRTNTSTMSHSLR